MTEPLHVKLLDLEPGMCRYPFGESDFTFCGHKQTAGSSYCFEHHELCLKPPTHHRIGADAPHFSAAIRKNNMPKCLTVVNDWSEVA